MWRCEASVGQDPTSRQPLLLLCEKPARLYGIAALCEPHAKTILGDK